MRMGTTSRGCREAGDGLTRAGVEVSLTDGSGVAVGGWTVTGGGVEVVAGRCVVGGDGLVSVGEFDGGGIGLVGVGIALVVNCGVKRGTTAKFG